MDFKNRGINMLIILYFRYKKVIVVKASIRRWARRGEEKEKVVMFKHGGESGFNF